MELAPSLPPLVEAWEEELLADPVALAQMRELASGPFHVLHPAQLRTNLREFLATARDMDVDCTVYFARKANKADCWLRGIADADQGVDVASGAELVGALAGGIRGTRLVITGAEKPDSLLWLGVRHGCTIAVDSPGELRRIMDLARADAHPGAADASQVHPNEAHSDQALPGTADPGQVLPSRANPGRARVLLRILPAEQPESRFGCTPQQWRTCISELPELRDHVDIAGVCFHLNGYSPQQRGREAHRCLDLLRVLRGEGWLADTLDIGGGFSVRYCSDAAWAAFQPTLTDASAFHAGRTPSASYPYGGEAATGADMLRAILNTPADSVGGRDSSEGAGEHDSFDDTGGPGASEKPSGASLAATPGGPDSSESPHGPSLAERLRADEVQLALEPGRALLAGCGLTVFPVQGVKNAGASRTSDQSGEQKGPRREYQILTAAGLSMSLSEQWKSSEFLPNPTLWPQREGAPTRACVGGSSCMEYDMLTWRTIGFPRAPQRGDLLIYHNTAGYQMDKNESSFHQLPLPERFVWDEPGRAFRRDHPLHLEL